MNCYNCGKDIKPTESSISLDGINHSHDECLRNPPKPAQCRFEELEDGEHFILAMTLAFGSSRVMQRVAESSKYNAQWIEKNVFEKIPADTQVVRVKQPKQDIPTTSKNIKLPRMPNTATHVLLHDYGSASNGVFILQVEFFKQVEGVWYKFETDTDNEYPGWVQAEHLYRNSSFADVVAKLQAL